MVNQHKMNGEKDPVFTPPSSPHGSDEEDDGVNLGDDGKAAPRVAANSPFPERPPSVFSDFFDPPSVQSPIRLNQDRGFANFPKPKDTPLTANGRARSYCGQVGRFQADTWLRLKEGAVFTITSCAPTRTPTAGHCTGIAPA